MILGKIKGKPSGEICKLFNNREEFKNYDKEIKENYTKFYGGLSYIPYLEEIDIRNVKIEELSGLTLLEVKKLMDYVHKLEEEKIKSKASIEMFKRI